MGPSVALLGGAILFLLALGATRSVTVRGPHAIGIGLKLGLAAAIGALAVAQGRLPPVALAAGRALVLAVLVPAERLLLSRP